MPCNSDYMNPNETEINYSRVLQLLDEVKNVRHSPNPSAWEGYDKRAYCKSITKSMLDGKTAELCGLLKKTTKRRLQGYSLELQTWWRDHQLADKRRLKEERDARLRAKQRKEALSKLTPRDRKVLGL